jgi:hypothetical protein
MRKLFSLVAALGLVMGAAPSAHAVVLPLAGATMTLSIGNPITQSIPLINFVWSGTGSANLTATSVTGLDPGILNFTGTLPITDPAATPMAEIQILGGSNGLGNFVGIDLATGGGPMALMGTANLCLFAPCAFAPINVTVPFTTGGVNGVGLGGAPIVAPGYVSVTVLGNMWTTGTVAISSFSATGSPLVGGHVKLVTPTVIMTDNSAFPIVPGFGILELWVPEPGTLILLASGVAGLAMVGRKRMGK